VLDDKDNIFIAGCRSSYDQVVGHYKRVVDGTTRSVQYVNNYTVGGGPTGVAIDGFGHVWSANEYTNSVSRIILPTETTPVQIDTYPVGYQPYNYSDMTGRVVRTITSRQGTWEAVFDSKVENYNWQQVRWRLKTALPEGTGVQVYVKTAASVLALNAKPYIEVKNGVNTPELEVGQYLKLKVKLTSNNLTDTPEVVEIQLY
jgi:streptogramin lyase